MVSIRGLRFGLGCALERSESFTVYDYLAVQLEVSIKAKRGRDDG